ncbi:MAG: FGGY-family carbohydrate kinase, partial [Bacteroidota bacterium]
LQHGTPITYRAGDQPNNAVALGGMKAREVVGTAGTSGVVYALTDQLIGDQTQRVNSFAHVNHTQEDPRIGVLLCINAAGSLYAWLRRTLQDQAVPYHQLERLAQTVPLGAEGLRIIPFGNGAERMLHQQPSAAHILNVQFHTHTPAHIYRAGLEAIACAFAYGIGAMKDMGIKMGSLKVGNDNLFQSDIFARIVATLTQTSIEVLDTSGAVGAARGAAAGLMGSDIFSFFQSQTPILKHISPDPASAPYHHVYQDWQLNLNRFKTHE